MKIKYVIIFLILFIVGLTGVSNAETPEITATSGVVIDCIDGKILYSKDMDVKLYPASLTNVLTAILVVENCNLQDEVTISKDAIQSVEYGYLVANMKEGEILTVEQLLNLLLISSYNDVANALAEHVGGTRENFVVMMNNKAAEIGCTNSNFTNCNGEHNENHYSTAHDLALIGKYAMQYDEIKNIAKNTYYELGPTNKYDGDDRLYPSANEMLLSWNKNYYKNALGIKTGFTTPAGQCLMVYAEKYDMPFVAVVLKSTTSDSKYEDARKILEDTFAKYTIRTIATLGTNLQTLNIKSATQETKKLNAVLEKTIIAVVKEENKEVSIEPKITIKNNLKAPIKKSEVVGTVSYEIEGKTYTANLIAENDVEKSYQALIFFIIFVGIIALIGGIRIKRNT